MERSIKLIDSSYPLEHAKEVLSSLLNDKIKFLNHQIFSNEVRFGSDTAHLVQRVKDLQKEKESLHEMLCAVENGQCVVDINCDINISVKQVETA